MVSGEPARRVPKPRLIIQHLADVCTREGLADLGVRASRHVAEEGLHPRVRAAVYAAPTLFNALCVLQRAVRIQSNQLEVWVEPHGNVIRLCHAHAVGRDFPGYPVTESFTTHQLVRMLRRFCEPEWVYSRAVKGPYRGMGFTQPFAEEGVLALVREHYAGIVCVWLDTVEPVRL